MALQVGKLNTTERITYFAKADARGRMTPFGIKAEDRTRHMYVIGKTGMGKSTLLENLAVQDIRNGEGLAFVDPHGKSAETLLNYVPEDRLGDVLYFAPFDMDYPITFNVMEDVGYDKRHLVSNGLMAAFKKIWVDVWSSRMEYILTNTILALLEYPDTTLLDVNRMYTNKPFRDKVILNIKDPLVKAFWVDEYSKYNDRYTQDATPAIQNKIGQFTGNPLIRNIIGQPTSSFDLRELMDQKKIIIVNLSKGKVGEGNANLLGSMMITKIYLAALSRADVEEAVLRKLPNFYLYVDEFQSFANESFADILSEARKYKLCLTMAHQYIEQMSEEVRAAVFGNVGTMIVFRIGAFDADVLEKEFFPQFTATDLVNLGFAQIYLKLMIDGVASQPFSAVTMPPIEVVGHTQKKAIIESSRRLFAKDRAGVEQYINKVYAPSDQKTEESLKKENKKKEKANSAYAQNKTYVKKESKEYRGGDRPQQDDDRRYRDTRPHGPYTDRDNKDDRFYKQGEERMYRDYAEPQGAQRHTQIQERADIPDKTSSPSTDSTNSNRESTKNPRIQPKFDRGITKESKLTLRDVLASVLQKEQSDNKKQSENAETEKQGQENAENKKESQNSEDKSNTPREISQDVLRKLLQE